MDPIPGIEPGIQVLGKTYALADIGDDDDPLLPADLTIGIV
jgi:hypothetical protein